MAPEEEGPDPLSKNLKVPGTSEETLRETESRKVEWNREDLKWVLDLIERDSSAYRFAPPNGTEEKRQGANRQTHLNWRALFNVARRFSKTPYDDSTKMQRRIRDLKVKALKAQSECKDMDEIDTQLVRIERGPPLEGGDLPQLPKPEEGETNEALEELKMLIEAERKELSLNPSTFASPIGQLSDHRMAERKVQNWPTEDLKWVLDQIERNPGAFGYGVSKEDRASMAKPIFQNWQSLFNVARHLNKTPYDNCGKMSRRIRDLKAKALRVVASGEKYPLSDIEEVLLRIERSGEVNPVKGDIPDIEWPSEELREMSRYTPPTAEEYPQHQDTKPDVYRSNLLENYDAILPDFSPPPVKRKKQPKVKEKSAPARQTLAFQPTDVYDRFLFNTREQVAGEPLDVFAQSLKNLLWACNYHGASEEHLSSLVRDRFVAGLSDKQVQYSLLQYNSCDLSLERAIELATSLMYAQGVEKYKNSAASDEDLAPTVKVEVVMNDGRVKQVKTEPEDHYDEEGEEKLFEGDRTMKSEELGSDGGGGDDYNGEEDAEDLPLKAESKSEKVYPRGWSNLQFKEPTKCLLCDQTFTNRNDINRHVRDTHKQSDGNVECLFCEFRAPSILKLKKHIHQVHNNGRKGRLVKKSITKAIHGDASAIAFPHCLICDKTLTDEYQLKIHYRRVHGELIDAAGGDKADRCAICGPESEPLGTDIIRHLAEAHNDDKGQVCHICLRQLKPDESLRQHIAQLHEKAGGTVCQYCGDAFMNIENHIATWHKTEQPWKCNLCDFKHATKVGLKNHKLYYHPKEGTSGFHMCDRCPFKSRSKSNLKQHIQVVHDKERPFKCTQCDKSWFHKRQLNDHIDVVHLNKLFECQPCNKKFHQRGSYREHMRSVHGGTWQNCDQCTAKFMNAQALKRHVRGVHLKVPLYDNPKKNIPQQQQQLSASSE